MLASPLQVVSGPLLVLAWGRSKPSWRSLVNAGSEIAGAPVCKLDGAKGVGGSCLIRGSHRDEASRSGGLAGRFGIDAAVRYRTRKGQQSPGTVACLRCREARLLLYIPAPICILSRARLSKNSKLYEAHPGKPAPLSCARPNVRKWATAPGAVGRHERPLRVEAV
jgi:hypothetical protein